jgi:hypothetical protein
LIGFSIQEDFVVEIAKQVAVNKQMENVAYGQFLQMFHK